MLAGSSMWRVGHARGACGRNRAKYSKHSLNNNKGSLSSERLARLISGANRFHLACETSWAPKTLESLPHGVSSSPSSPATTWRPRKHAPLSSLTQGSW